MRLSVPRVMTAIPSTTRVVSTSASIGHLNSKASAYEREAHPFLNNRVTFVICASDYRRGRTPLAAHAEPPNVAISKTVDEMVVDHPDCLHVAVDYGGSHEAESPPLQIAAECVRLARRGGDLTHGFPTILSRATVDELPAIRVEAAVLPLHRQKRSSVLDRGRDLQAVPDDPGIGGQLVDPSRGVPRDLVRIEAAECAAVALALVEHN